MALIVVHETEASAHSLDGARVAHVVRILDQVRCVVVRHFALGNHHSRSVGPLVSVQTICFLSIVLMLSMQMQ